MIEHSEPNAHNFLAYVLSKQALYTNFFQKLFMRLEIPGWNTECDRQANCILNVWNNLGAGEKVPCK